MTPIEIVEYDPTWPACFAAESARVAGMLGGLLREIEHVGSTSVPGLAAKPKIDIDAVLHRQELLEEAICRVRRNDAFTYHADPYGDGMWTFTANSGRYGIRLYLCRPDNPTHLKRILFRDWLRLQPGDATEYAALKRTLASGARGDRTAYTAGKSAFVERIVGLAAASNRSAAAAAGEFTLPSSI